MLMSDCRQNAFGQHSRSVFLVFGSKSVYLINNKHFWAPLFPFLAIIFASFFRFMQANVSPVSYTHLDVYKRQSILKMTARCIPCCYPVAEPVAGENPETISFSPL